MNQTMLAVNDTWDEKESFRLIPLTDECPFVEVLYDPNEKVLALLSKHKKNTFKFIPRVNEKQEYVTTKKDGQIIPAMDRKLIEYFNETFIKDKQDIKNLLKLLVINQDFDFDKFLNAEVLSIPSQQ